MFKSSSKICLYVYAWPLCTILVSKYEGRGENDFKHVNSIQNRPHSQQRVAGSLPRCWPYTPTFDIARQPSSSIWARQGSACKRTRSSPGCYRQHSYSPGTSTTPKHLKPFVARTLVSSIFLGSFGLEEGESGWLAWWSIPGWWQCGRGTAPSLPPPGQLVSTGAPSPQLHCTASSSSRDLPSRDQGAPPPGHTPRSNGGPLRAPELQNSRRSELRESGRL